eukprot:1283764-Pyramimonas_sp.AAC.1
MAASSDKVDLWIISDGPVQTPKPDRSKSKQIDGIGDDTPLRPWRPGQAIKHVEYKGIFDGPDVYQEA